MIGSPLHPRMSLKLANGNTFTVRAANNSQQNLYIQSATLNGAPLTVPVITWEQIQSGGTLAFVMGPQPSKWGSGYRPTLIP
jgi:putative alpha-1,2-mannosidase